MAGTFVWNNDSMGRADLCDVSSAHDCAVGGVAPVQLDAPVFGVRGLLAGAGTGGKLSPHGRPIVFVPVASNALALLGIPVCRGLGNLCNWSNTFSTSIPRRGCLLGNGTSRRSRTRLVPLCNPYLKIKFGLSRGAAAAALRRLLSFGLVFSPRARPPAAFSVSRNVWRLPLYLRPNRDWADCNGVVSCRSDSVGDLFVFSQNCTEGRAAGAMDRGFAGRPIRRELDRSRLRPLSLRAHAPMHFSGNGRAGGREPGIGKSRKKSSCHRRCPRRGDGCGLPRFRNFAGARHAPAGRATASAYGRGGAVPSNSRLGIGRDADGQGNQFSTGSLPVPAAAGKFRTLC